MKNEMQTADAIEILRNRGFQVDFVSVGQYKLSIDDEVFGIVGKTDLKDLASRTKQRRIK